MKNNPDQEQLDSLMESNMGLVVSLADSFKPQDHDEREEYIQLGRIALWRAIQNHDPNRAKLSTLIWTYVRRDIITYLQKKKKRGQKLQINESLCGSTDSLSNIWDYIPDYLSDRELNVITLRLEGRTFSDIGKKLGYSRGWANNTFKSAVEKISDANEKKNLNMQ